MKTNIRDRLSLLALRVLSLGSGELIYRLVLAWVAVSAASMVIVGHNFTYDSFFQGIDLPLYAAAVAAVWLALCLVRSRAVTVRLMLAAVLCYAVMAAVDYNSFGFSVGLCAAVGVFICISNTDNAALRLHRPAPWIFMALTAAALTAFIGLVCVLTYKNHWTPNYDFGIFAQMFENMRRTGLPLATCERDTLLSHFAVHFSPIFYLLLPIYMLLPDPCTLLVMQVFVVASGAVPLLLICKRRGLSNAACCAFSAVYAMYPCFAGGCLYYLHENNFLAPLLMWLMYFIEADKLVPTVISALLVLSVKEDAALYVIIVGVYMIASKHRPKRGVLLAAAGVIWFVTVTALLAQYGDGVMTYRYDNYIYDHSGSLFTAIKAVIMNPVFVISQSFTEMKLIFILKMLLPLGFLPLLTKKASRFVLMIPFLLINLMTTYKYQYDIGYHYCFGSGSLLLYLAAVNYSELKRPKLLLYSFFCSAIIFTGIYQPRNKYINTYEAQEHERVTMERAFSTVPEDESVAASTFLTANLYRCSELYQLETTKQQTKYYVIDLRYKTDEVNVDDYLTDEFETVFFEKGIIAVFMRK